MKILVIGKFYSEGFALHISENLSEMSHDVIHFDPGLRQQSKGKFFNNKINKIIGTVYNATDNVPYIRSIRIKSLYSILDAFAFELIIVCHDFLWPNEVIEIKRKTSAQVVMWFPDAFVNFGKAYFMNAPYDALFFKDPYIKYVLSDILKSKIYYLPECFNIYKHWLPEHEINYNSDYDCDITTAGNFHSWRVAFFDHFANYNVKIWGDPPPLWMPFENLKDKYQGRSVYNHEKVLAFRGAKIVINNLHFGETWGLNVRAFEAAGCGAFQMVNWRPNLDHLFKDGRELITFKSISDLKSKINYWLPRKDERFQISKAGMVRAHNEHTYSLRLNLLLNTINGKESGYPLPERNMDFL
jgi:spore maturation protein CgeB